MKSEHRHELQANELQKITVQAEDFLSTHSTKVIVGLIAFAVVVCGLTIWTQTRAAANLAAWSEMSKADDTEAYSRVAMDHPSSAAGAWARLREAESNLSSGLLDLFRNRRTANNDLKRARETFESLLDPNSKATPQVRERALFGLARTLEATCSGETGPAINRYRELVDRFPKSIYVLYAQDRMEELAKADAADFYAWFAKQEPQPKIQSTTPKDGFNIPDDFELPSPAPETPAHGSGAPPATEKANSENAVPANEAPAPPATSEGGAAPESKPTTEEKPAPTPEK